MREVRYCEVAHFHFLYELSPAFKFCKPNSLKLSKLRVFAYIAFPHGEPCMRCSGGFITAFRKKSESQAWAVRAVPQPWKANGGNEAGKRRVSPMPRRTLPPQ